MSKKRQLKLGHMIEGAGRTWTDWRHPNAVPSASTSFQYYKQRAQLAEQGKLDFIFIADSLFITDKSSPHYLNRFEPLTLLSALAAATSQIGLVATVTASYTEPFNLARQFASLDHISQGRAGWNVVTSWLDGTAANFSKTEHLEHGERYRRADEFIHVVRGLWDSWEDDAFVYDKASGVFFDPAKLHALEHAGEFFQVRGPLNIARSAQGQPVIFQAGTSDDGRNFAARHADAIFVGHDGIEEARDYYRDVKSRAASFGRNPDALFVLPAVAPVVGSTEAEAEALWIERTNLVSIEAALRMLGRGFNDYDFTQHELDAPFPALGRDGLNSSQGAVIKITRAAREEGLTLREVALRFATPRGNFVGTPEQLADKFEHWLETAGSDGFVIGESLPGQFQRLVETVLPILRARGSFREEYEGSTFRDNLGLDVPENRYTRGGVVNGDRGRQDATSAPAAPPRAGAPRRAPNESAQPGEST
jgi:FMN-dependent oxidoreductase (nitrilotriacetate monooxygenase family)